jgi:hypothetical protein
MVRLGNLVKEYGWLGTVLAGVGAALWAIYTNMENARLEYIKDFHTKQIDTVFMAAETVSSLVSEPEQQKWNDDEKAFWNLHFGQLVLFENHGIECAMANFGFKLSTTTFANRHELGPSAYFVSGELRQFVTALNNNGWKIDPSNLTDVKADLAEMLSWKDGRLAFKATAADFKATAANFKKKIEAKCGKAPQDAVSAQ